MSRKLLLATFILAVTAIVAVHALNFPGSVPHFKEVAGGLDLLDTTPSFDPDAVHARVAAYGDQGRQAYRNRLFTIDVLLPLSIFPFLYLFMLGAVSKLQLSGAPKWVLLIAPALYLIFDLIENAFLFDIVSDYPARHAAAESLLPYLTSIKRVGAVSGLFGPPLLYAIAFLRKRQPAEPPQEQSKQP